MMNSLPTSSDQSWHVLAPDASQHPEAGNPGEQSGSRGLQTAAYVGVVLFCFVYFFRPEDYLPSLAALPMAKVFGLVTGGALLAAMLVERVRIGREGKLLLMLFAWLCLAIPGSIWRGGSFDAIVNGFSKSVLIAIAAGCAITSVARLRRLMMIQTLAMLLMALFALGQARHADRMYGIGQMFADPNDFALNLCIILPLCVAMLLSSRALLAKLFWTGAAALALLAIISTYSRGGFLALTAVILTMVLRFGVSKRKAALIFVFLAILVGIGLAVVGSSSYFDRMKSITNLQEDETGSAEARKELLIRSLEITAAHPLLGVGPAEFVEASGAWHQTHNSYTQLSAEAGIPALVLFLMLISRTFKNLRQAQTGERGTQGWYLAGGLYCAMAGYVVGAFFLSTAYWLMPYLLMAYAAAAKTVTCPVVTSDADHGLFERQCTDGELC